MDSYTITIAPNDDSGSSTRLVVNSSDGQVRITDVHLHAAQGLSSGHIPNVDFGLLLQAVIGGGPAPDAGAPPTATARVSLPGSTAGEIESSAPPADEQPAAAPAARSRRARAATPAETAPAAPPRSTGAKTAKRATKAQARKAAPVKKATPVRKATPVKKAAPVKMTRVAKKAPAKTTRVAKKAPAKANTERPGRVYRRTPDDLAVVFEQMGTVAAVAEHYGVPRYTAQGWIGRLRAAG